MLLQELLALQQDNGPKNLGFFGTRNMGMTHQKLVEILSYAMVSSVGANMCIKWLLDHVRLSGQQQGHHLTLE